MPENGFLNIDKMDRGGLSDTELLQKGVTDCALNMGCHTVIWESNKTITNTIFLKGHVRILGMKKSGVLWNPFNTFKGVIVADLKDKNKDLFVFEQNRAIETGQAIEDVLIIPISEGRTVIDLGNSYDVTCRNIHIQSYLDKGRHFQTGIKLAGGINQTIENIDIENLKGEGFLLTAANTTELVNVRTLYAKYGVRVTNGSVFIRKGLFERCDSSAVQFYGTNCHIDHVYTEATPATANTKTNVFDIRKADLLTITRCEINGGEVSIHPGLVNIALDNVGVATIQGNEIMQAGSNLSTTKNTGEVVWMGNTESPALKDHHPKVYDIDRISFIGNISKFKRQEIQRNAINRLASNKPEFTESTFLGTVNISDATIKNQSENLFRWSENMVRNWLFSTQMWTMINSDSSPDVLLQKTYRRWFIRYNGSPGMTIKAGEYYTITFQARMGAEPFNNNFNRFVIDIGDVNETMTMVTIDTLDKSNLREYTYTIKVPEHTKPINCIDFSWESTTGDRDDYIWLDKVQLENSQSKGKYIKTEGTVIIEPASNILGN
jgi:hypothetical protein